MSGAERDRKDPISEVRCYVTCTHVKFETAKRKKERWGQVRWRGQGQRRPVIWMHKKIIYSLATGGSDYARRLLQLSLIALRCCRELPYISIKYQNFHLRPYMHTNWTANLCDFICRTMFNCSGGNRWRPNRIIPRTHNDKMKQQASVEINAK